MFFTRLQNQLRSAAVKWAISLAIDERRALPTWVQRQIDRDPALQHYQRQTVRLTSKLKRDAAAIRLNSPPSQSERQSAGAESANSAAPVPRTAVGMGAITRRRSKLGLGVRPIATCVVAAALIAMIVHHGRWLSDLTFSDVDIETAHVPAKVVTTGEVPTDDDSVRPTSTAVGSEAITSLSEAIVSSKTLCADTLLHLPSLDKLTQLSKWRSSQATIHHRIDSAQSAVDSGMSSIQTFVKRQRHQFASDLRITLSFFVRELPSSALRLVDDSDSRIDDNEQS